MRNLSSGESSCIALARCRGGVVVTDDRFARGSCRDRGIQVTGTIGILKVLCLDHVLKPHEADEILARMVKAGFYSPVRRISDVL